MGENLAEHASLLSINQVQTPFFYLASLPLSRWRPLGDRGPRPRETLPGARRRAKLSSRPIGAEPARPVKLTSLAVMSWVFELARRTVRRIGKSNGRIGKSNGLFHRLLRPPCRPLPATCSAPSAPARAARRPALHMGVGDGPLGRIGKSNGLFHRLLRPPCRPLPATCSAPSAPAWAARRPALRTGGG